ncbi:MAG: ParB/RepB/Spo0J family partition protein [Rubrivivax sp.]|nr:ParB/RepB/Spo0J family partition protein [Rubrivivax sp.]
MPLQLDDLAALDAPSLSSNGQPLLLPVEDIDEDPEQPRREFDANALQELAETIRQRGVRQAISVRPDLLASGRWVLNFGARRLRASKLAGLATIPAFVDASADSYDQVIENEQREGLKPLELALFVQKRLALGDKQADIAKNLGKSRQWVTLATALIEPPDWLLQAYRDGRCRGMNELYELRRLHGQHAEAVADWVTKQPGLITRERIAELRAQLTGDAVQDRSGASTQDDGAIGTKQPVQAGDRAGSGPADPVRKEPHSRRSPNSDQRIHVEFDGQDYQLVVSVAPDQPGHLYVRPLVGGPRRLAPASALKLLGFVGG